MSIFRYPGGKSRLLQPIYSAISKLDLKPKGCTREMFHDVFVGGGSVLVHMAQLHPDAMLFANDLDRNVFSFWSLVAEGKKSEADEFDRLLAQRPTLDLFQELRARSPRSRAERAYYAVFFNRTTFSGISTAGPIGGLQQKSKWTVDCRYNAKRLIDEFRELRVLMKGRLRVSNLECVAYLQQLPWTWNEALYLDPPYYKQGQALYAEWMTPDQHAQLSAELKKRRNWVLSYDNVPEIHALYGWADRADLDVRYSVNGVKTKWNSTKECLFWRLR